VKAERINVKVKDDEKNKKKIDFKKNFPCGATTHH
jgi:hypothetical protein